MLVSHEYEYLYLDAIYIHVEEMNIRNIPVFIVLTVNPNGTKHIITFNLAKSEL